MKTPAVPNDARTTRIPLYDATLLLAIASRCRKGLTTTADADALEELARRIKQNQ